VPTRKNKKKPSGKSSKKGSRGKALAAFLMKPAVTNLLKVLLLIIFVLGQAEIFRGQALSGFILSLAAVLLGCVMFFGDGIFHWVQSKLPAPKVKPSKAAVPSSKGVKAAKMTFSPKALTPMVLLRGLGCLVSFAVAGVGQYYWAQAGDGPALMKGAWFFMAAVIMFVACLWPWMREGLKNIPLPPKWEMGILAVILLIAIFLRSYEIGTIPSGLFIDQGFQGLAALRILHEGWRPFYVEDIFHAYALALYQLAIWFKIFGAGEVSLKLFYAFLAILGLPLMYWTFRQLAGPRFALLSLFIVAVMRWHINFSRNGFPTVQLPLYMFGTLGFLLYGLRNGKRWPFVVSAVFFASGFYTYQAFKIVPVLLLVYGLYELIANFKTMKKLWDRIALFTVSAFVLSFPVFYDIVIKKNPGTRETELSIFNRVRMEHSLRPFLDVVYRTALMFNRQGDPNPRHNLQDYRMLDDISGTLLILGLAYALFRCRRRKYFYALTGFVVMSLPCILSIDAAHANRLFGMTPFLAFLIATPLAALWGRVREFGGRKGEWFFLILLAPFLWLMASQNFDVYFHKQARNAASWNEYAAQETAIGRIVAKNGSAYEYYVSPRFFNYYTINFLGYENQNHIRPLLLPDSLISHTADDSRGLYFALEQGRTGVWEALKTIYPKGIADTLVDPAGNTVEYFFHVPAEEVAKVRGLAASFDRPVAGKSEQQLTQFPSGLPVGPYHAALKGNLYIPESGEYHWDLKTNVRVVLRVKGKKVGAGTIHLDKGYHPVQFDVTVPADVTPSLRIQQQRKGILAVQLDAGSFDSLPPYHGLMGSYHRDQAFKSEPFLVQWDPVMNYTNGNDFSAAPPYAIHWSGTLTIDKPGAYRFFSVPGGMASVKIDGKTTMGSGGNYMKNDLLTAGVHSIDVYYGKPDMNWSSFSLCWTTPGGKMEVVPYSTFGLIP
jgi:hypothetical protein